MKFAIVSDTHDNITNFNKVIHWLNKEKIGKKKSQEYLISYFQGKRI